MGEPEAYKALEEGYIRVDGKVYNMEKQPQGWCDGCCFYNMEVCPSIAKKVCCTGGVIFHEGNKNRTFNTNKRYSRKI